MKTIKSFKLLRECGGLSPYHEGYEEALKDVLKLIDETDLKEEGQGIPLDKLKSKIQGK